MRLRRRLDRAGGADELGNSLARVRAGVWERQARPPPRASAATAVPTFHEYASAWLQAKATGVLGDRPIGANTRGRLPLAADRPSAAVLRRVPARRDRPRAVPRFKAHKLQEAAELRRRSPPAPCCGTAAGGGCEPLGPASIRKLIDTLAAILEEAVEDGLLERNPARGKRMRSGCPSRARTFLEMDELAALIEAAGEQDARRSSRLADRAEPGTRDQGRRALAARACGRARSPRSSGSPSRRSPTTSAQLGARTPATYIGRRAIVETLGAQRRARQRAVRHAHPRRSGSTTASGAHFRIPDAKTEAGIREVQVSPDLVEVLVAHLDASRRAGHPTGPGRLPLPEHPRRADDPPARRRDPPRGSRRWRPSGSAARGLPPLPNTTPHTLRRTYISIALLANGFDVKWVMSQVGHADSKMTMDVYAQLEQRVERPHGTAFDALVQDAPRQDPDDVIGPRSGHVTLESPPSAASRHRHRGKEKACKRRPFRVARPGLEPGTPRFSVVCSTN